jgi:hypothetical protein
MGRDAHAHVPDRQQRLGVLARVPLSRDITAARLADAVLDCVVAKLG